MLLSAVSSGNVSLLLIEGSVTAIAAAAAFAFPRLGAATLSRIERTFGSLSRRRTLAVLAVGVSTLVLRLAILPFSPIPLPSSPNDFSFLLSADTFAHGRLSNPTPAMWTHFESIHISMHPTYGSMYFPGQGLVLAAGQVFFSRPWFGLFIVSALMCSAICWMLQAWLPPGWALLGGILAMLRLGLFSYWINTYTGGGLILALGGALVLGSLPRLKKTAALRYGLLMAAGIILLLLTRPYEGLLLCIPVAIALGRWALCGKRRPRPQILLGRAALPLALVAAALAWLGYYDYRAFGSPFTLPYAVNRAAYAAAPYFLWQSPRHDIVYRNPEMRKFYTENELDYFNKIRNPATFIPYTLGKAYGIFQFFAGAALYLPLIMLPRTLRDRRIRFVVLSVLLLAAGLLLEIVIGAHYVAPFTAAFYAIGLQCMRHLRLWTPEGRPVGLAMVRFSVLICFCMAGLRLWADPLHLSPPQWPPSQWNYQWYGPAQFGLERAGIAAQLESRPGKQLVIVRYSATHNPQDEWVYNAADIEDSRVVWARELDPASNLDLIHYYRNRKPWLVEPDAASPVAVPYSIPEPPSAAVR